MEWLTLCPPLHVPFCDPFFFFFSHLHPDIFCEYVNPVLIWYAIHAFSRCWRLACFHGNKVLLKLRHFRDFLQLNAGAADLYGCYSYIAYISLLVSMSTWGKLYCRFSVIVWSNCELSLGFQASSLPSPRPMWYMFGLCLFPWQLSRNQVPVIRIYNWKQWQN